MKLNIRYEHISEKHINAAADLVMAAYNDERMAVPFLPEDEEHLSNLQKAIENLFTRGTGVAAVAEGELIGFVAGFKINELFGKCKGIYSPLYGHGVVKEHSKYLYQELYKHAADLWVKDAYTQHALTFFAHDKVTIDTWFWLGFGLRCVDAMREVQPIEFKNPEVSIKKVDFSDIPALADVQNKLHLYFKNSPLFMPRTEEDPIEYLTEWLSNDNHHIWAAYRDGKVVGHMKIEPTAETFVSEHPSVMNITGAYVDETVRKSGIGLLLLAEIQHWLRDNGYSLCGVDFESFNLDGGDFWMKHFTPYTYSLVRRIDERVL